MEEKVYTVSNINKYIKMVFDRDSFLSSVVVKGEITNFKAHSSGHLYFTLKDENSTIKCIMFKSAADKLKIKINDGTSVIITGSVSVYEVGGTYQIYVREMVADGVGALYAKYEELKRKLEAEGLFSPEQKKKIPFLPTRVGVITSSTGAVIRDIINVSTRRFSKVNLLLYPATVQGDKVASTVISGINYFNEDSKVELIIIARGGGSFEDLFGFNDEALARAIFKSEIPIISAVGHETDFTICDFVSDLRAPTPSAAAEIAYPSEMEIMQRLDSYKSRLYNSLRNVLNMKRQYLENMKTRRLEKTPMDMISKYRMMCDTYLKRIEQKIKEIYVLKLKNYEKQIALLDSYSPLKTMTRGYVVAQSEEGKVVQKTSDVKIGKNINIKVLDGSIKAKVEEIMKEE